MEVIDIKNGDVSFGDSLTLKPVRAAAPWAIVETGYIHRECVKPTLYRRDGTRFIPEEGLGIEVMSWVDALIVESKPSGDSSKELYVGGIGQGESATTSLRATEKGADDEEDKEELVEQAKLLLGTTTIHKNPTVEEHETEFERMDMS